VARYLRRVNRLLSVVDPSTGEVLGASAGYAAPAGMGEDPQPEQLRADSERVSHLLDCLDADALTAALDSGDLVDAVERSGKRGAIREGMSRRSARRLRHRLLLVYSGAGALGWSVRSAVGTFGGDDGLDLERVYRCVKAIGGRIARRWGGDVCGVWVREWHRDGRRHVNFVLCVSPGLDAAAVVDDVGVMWLDVTGDGGSAREHRELYGWWHQDARSSAAWAAYVTGECSKGSQQTVPEGQAAGRAWGVLGGGAVGRLVAAAVVRVEHWDAADLHARVVAADAALRPGDGGDWCVTQRAGDAWYRAVVTGDVAALRPARRAVAAA